MLAGLSGALAACGGPAALVREGRVDEAWREVCQREPEDGPSPDMLLFPEERAAFREALGARTRGTLSARALSRETLNERFGEPVFPRDMVILVTHLDVTTHPGAGIDVTPRLVLGGVPSVHWGRRDTWRLAAVEPPEPASFGSYNLAGALLDAVVAGLTLGGVDLELRGQKAVLPDISPGRAGTGTPVQEDVLFQLMDEEDQCSSIHPGRFGQPCDAFFVLASGTPANPDYDPVRIDDGPVVPPRDALILRVEHVSDRVSDAGCSLGYDVVLPLPDGPDVAARINALFAAGPVDLAPSPGAP